MGGSPRIGRTSKRGGKHSRSPCTLPVPHESTFCQEQRREQGDDGYESGQRSGRRLGALERGGGRRTGERARAHPWLIKRNCLRTVDLPDSPAAEDTTSIQSATRSTRGWLPCWPETICIGECRQACPRGGTTSSSASTTAGTQEREGSRREHVPPRRSICGGEHEDEGPCKHCELQPCDPLSKLRQVKADVAPWSPETYLDLVAHVLAVLLQLGLNLLVTCTHDRAMDSRRPAQQAQKREGSSEGEGGTNGHPLRDPISSSHRNPSHSTRQETGEKEGGRECVCVCVYGDADLMEASERGWWMLEETSEKREAGPGCRTAFKNTADSPPAWPVW